VTLDYDPGYPSEEPAVLILAHRDEPSGAPAADLTDWDFSGWKVNTFPPEVCTRFVVMSAFGGPDGW
jgi:hypothetical protein